MKSSNKGLTPKQEAFVRYYIQYLSVTQAAKEAGLSRQHCYDLLTKTEISKAIDRGVRARMRGAEVSAEKLIRSIAEIAFSDIANIVDLDSKGATLKEKKEVLKKHSRAISSISCSVSSGDGGSSESISVSMHNKGAAQDKLMKYLKLYAINKPTDDGDTESIDTGLLRAVEEEKRRESKGS